MKKVLFVLAATACMVACGNKAAQDDAVVEDSVVVAEDTVVVEEEVAAPAEEATAPAVDANKEKETLIDLYVKACEEENEVEATRVAKRIHNEYDEILTSADIERMTNASAVLAAKRAEQAKEGAEKAKEGLDALKNLKK